ncbi:5-exo-alcohol dehydrogenase [Sphaerisporangium siamense]|uniref:Threonine dehydrogenase-like Zn-dependent dehydrogenase n=1 Tax=Sphaerisporangium siamense TaxID=795645 RepID=A0A7W7D7Q1_9ACTN|nr:zinc-binding dehydrogenase [Sphaerisporangium siamense]MBB4701833.1 threonine dehydrogenase-like Zn-dependent dehydrogenase [Sphaerisporangium siamense]GII84259.1 5-exo-alcohol dehydrogenase [Sphaerisporangium siamense]
MSVPTATRAAVLTAHGEPLAIEELPLPGEIEPGAAIVKVDCATLCATDVHIWSGAMSFPGMLPMVLGHEMVGTVVAAGPGTVDALGRPVQPGQRIGWSESTCGHCYGCTVVRNPVACSNRGYGFLQRSDRFPFSTAGLAEYDYVTPGAQKLLLPEDVKDTWAASAGCAVKTVLHAFDRAGGVRTGSTVLVQGAGALGIVATAVASASGARTVITVGAPDSRLELAKRFGADVTIGLDGDADSRRAAVMEATGGRGADLVLDLAGAPGVGAEAVDAAAFGGTFVIVGTTGPRPDPIALGTIMGKELNVLGSLNGDIGDYHDSVEFLRAFQSRFPWDELFSAPVGLSGASEALAAMSRLEQVKAVVHPWLP